MFLFQILSLYAFILQAVYEKLQASTKTKQKKKTEGEKQVVHEKERCQLLTELMRQLKIEFQKCDKMLRKFYEFLFTKANNLNSI